MRKNNPVWGQGNLPHPHVWLWTAAFVKLIELNLDAEFVRKGLTSLLFNVHLEVAGQPVAPVHLCA